MKKNKRRGQKVNDGNIRPTKGLRTRQQNNSWLRWSPLILIASVFAIYWKVTAYDYIGLDDTTILKAKTFLLSDFSNWKLAFTTDAFLEATGSFYRPLQTLSFMLDAHYGGADPFHFHVSNVVAYALACTSILLLLRTLGMDALMALLLSLLYSLHPLFVSTVAWIPSRGDVFLTICSVLTFMYFIRAVQQPGAVPLLLHAVFLLLAYLSKETAMAVPVLCSAYYAVALRKNHPPTLLLRFGLIWVVITAVWYGLHAQLNTIEASGDLIGLRSLIANIQTIPESFGKFLLPVGLKLIPLFNTTDTVLGIVCIVLLVAGISYARKWSDPLVLFGLFWFVLFISPVMLYRKVDAAFMFEYLYHRSFIASIGVVIVLGQLLKPAFEGRRRMVTIAALCLLCTLAAASSFSELNYFKNGEVFFTEAAIRTPQSSMCYNNIGLARQNSGQYAEAIEQFSRAIAIQPDYSKAYINRGGTHFQLGQLDSALRDFNRGIELDSSSADAFSNRGAIEQRMGRLNDALADLNRALELNPYYSDGFQNRGVVKNSLKMYASALDDFNEAIRINPKNASAFFGRGFSKRNLQDANGSCNDWKQAVQLGSRDADTFIRKYCQ